VIRSENLGFASGEGCSERAVLYFRELLFNSNKKKFSFRRVESEYGVCKLLLILHCNCICLVPFLRYSMSNNGVPLKIEIASSSSSLTGMVYRRQNIVSSFGIFVCSYNAGFQARYRLRKYYIWYTNEMRTSAQVKSMQDSQTRCDWTECVPRQILSC